jgi:hypothetical protein
MSSNDNRKLEVLGIYDVHINEAKLGVVQNFQAVFDRGYPTQHVVAGAFARFINGFIGEFCRNIFKKRRECARLGLFQATRFGTDVPVLYNLGNHVFEAQDNESEKKPTTTASSIRQLSRVKYLRNAGRNAEAIELLMDILDETYDDSDGVTKMKLHNYEDEGTSLDDLIIRVAPSEDDWMEVLVKSDSS